MGGVGIGGRKKLGKKWKGSKAASQWGFFNSVSKRKRCGGWGGG